MINTIIKLVCVLTVCMLYTSCKDNIDTLQTLHYEGHLFILYDGGSYAGGIIHHPNCCKDNE
jgi:hypothetical protein